MKKKLIAGAVGVALVSGAGLGIAQAAQAATPTPAPNARSSATPGDTTAGRHDGRGGKGSNAAALATKLGLPEATVSDALTAARDQTKSTTRPSPTATQAEKDAARAAHQTALATALAAKLNIDEATVTAALTAVQTEREAAEATAHKATLDLAVTNGTLTQAEADAVRKASDAGIVEIRDGGHGPR